MSKRRPKPTTDVPPRRVGTPWPWIVVAILAVAAVVAAGTMHPRRGANESRPPSETPSTPRANEALAARPFLPTVENKNPRPGPAPPGMVWIPGGEFSMGAQDPPDMNDSVGMQATTDSRPVHRVYVDGFWMDATEVTNEQFAAFIKATGYVTVAERTPRPEEFPTAAPQDLTAGSVVFSPPGHAVPLNDHFQWWSFVDGASWRHPLGPQSSITGKPRLPVVQVAYEDAFAYAHWAGKRLPTEAEFSALMSTARATWLARVGRARSRQVPTTLDSAA